MLKILRNQIFRIPVYLYVILVLFPFLWISATAFKKQIDILLGKVIFKPTLDNFYQLFASKEATFIYDLINSSIIAIISTSLVLIICSAAAYTLRRLKFPDWLRTSIFFWVLIFYMLPAITYVSSWFVIANEIGLFNTRIAVIIGHVTINLPLGLWLMSNFISEIPDEIQEAAKIDGCSNFQIFLKIMLPLIKPGLTATAVLVFLFSWNDFLVALTLTTKSTQTVPVSIATFAQGYEVRYGAMAMAAFISTLPALVLLLFGERHIVKGLLAGSLK
jgi:multiple sugar transport system permease protein